MRINKKHKDGIKNIIDKIRTDYSIEETLINFDDKTFKAVRVGKNKWFYVFPLNSYIEV